MFRVRTGERAPARVTPAAEAADGGWTRWAGRTCVAALSYAVVGRLALLLAIPPGYVTPVWPAAGIALFVFLRWGNGMWLGVLLGSTVANAWINQQQSAAVDVRLLAAIGAGAAAQAWLGAFLIRRAVGPRPPLLLVGDIFRFVIWSGPVACLLNSLWGALCLSWAGVSPWSNFALSFAHWWVGDTIGVLVVVPVLLTLFGEPREEWRARRRTVALPVLVTFTAIVAIFAIVRGWERDRVSLEFGRRAAAHVSALNTHLDRYVEKLCELESYYRASTHVEREEFKVFVEDVFERYPGIAALSWNMRLGGGERAAFERAMRAEGFTDFRIVERDPDGALVTASQRDEYVVVSYIEPEDEHRAAIGFDVASSVERASALRRARDTGLPTATARVRLVQDEGAGPGILVLHPIYANGRPRDTQAQRQAALTGYAVAVLRLRETMEECFAGLDSEGLGVRLVDASAEPGARVLYACADDRLLDLAAAEREPPRDPLALARVSEHCVAGRVWRMEISPDLHFIAAMQTWHAWLVLAGGLLFTGLLGIFLLVVSGRGILEVRQSQRLERANRILRERQEEMNQVLDSVSHDLKGPVVTITGFSAVARKAYEQGNVERVGDSLRRVDAASEMMRVLLDDLLEVGKIGRMPETRTTVDVAQVAEELRDAFELQFEEQGARFEVVAPLPSLHVDPTNLTRIFQNLLSNALKYGCGGPAPVIRLGGARVDGEVRLFVQDNGAGIPAAHHQRIFGLFRRLQSDDDGTGVGLTIVERVMREYDGRCWVESAEGEGATFWVAFPDSPARRAA